MKKIIAGVVLALGLVGAANADQYVQGDSVKRASVAPSLNQLCTELAQVAGVGDDDDFITACVWSHIEDINKRDAKLTGKKY
ncbi:TPA: hypothetical protein KKL41_002687 [Escherichia coli]|uniref:hypothetical protein n=1 Tax=Escherichia coli TaxID=562 RepID=UPI000E001975|nr:hypothetical protein [Escherichia coli]EIU8039838.1 hypothetical protein [Escherichia coli]EIW6265772.1 hypothetical protein [Escherichia coli]EJR7608708.1 hypothetical protein [Escherichia coli]MBI0999795.1 hypothetical protein [Escherichia coli]RBQ38394.1 hypothetical protein C2131_13935 [Escherichia coli]